MTTPLDADIEATVARGPFSPSWDSLESYRTPDWYQDAKFGIFIHWGVYAVPAFGSEWYAYSVYHEGSRVHKHHVETYGPLDQFGYKDFIPRLTADHFDPDAWAQLFQEAGARFVVPVAEHHDGFQMYKSALSPWNAAEMGPKRDVLRDIAAAVRARGLIFGASSHRAEHWWFFGGGRKFPSDVQDPRFEGLYGPAQEEPRYNQNHTLCSPDRAFLDDWLRRCCELVDVYRPRIVWFDWWIMNLAFKPYLKQFAAYYYNKAAAWGEEVAINYKYDAFPVGTAVYDVERGQLSGTEGLFWQTDTSIAKYSWGYVEGQQYKTATEIVCDLVDIVSKNGALLLNVGPRADGTIPEPEQEILRDIGAWLRVNGEAIYGTRPWDRFGEGPTRLAQGAFTDTQRSPYTSEDIRFTTRGDTLYAIVLGPLRSPDAPSRGTVCVKSITAARSEQIADVSVIAGARDVTWEMSDEGLRVTADWASEQPVVIKVRRRRG